MFQNLLLPLSYIHTYVIQHLVYFGALSDDEMVAVEVSPASLKEKLPPSFRKVFGRK